MLAGAVILCVRLALGFQFPVPWPDETGFLAQAFALAHTGSLFDPGLNPDRTVMWMPPGYMVLLAAIFRVCGYSFALARWVSTLACLACLGLMAGLVRRLARENWRTIMAWATGLAFVSPTMLVDSNIARMEMVFCCLILLCLTAIAAGRLHVAGAVLAAAALMHFNAVYFAPPVLMAFASTAWRGRLRRPHGTDWLAMAAAAAALAAYGLHVAWNWAGFVGDMNFQFQAKAFYGQNDPAHPAWLLSVGALAALPAAWRAGSLAGATAALFGLAFLAMVHEGHEVWYDFGLPLGFLLILLSLASAPAWRGRIAWTLATGGLLVFASLRVTPNLEPLLPQWRMVHRSVVAPSEIAKLRTFIATLHPGETVNFGWTGMEPFFFTDLARVGARWTIIRHSVTQVFPLRRADWRVRCDSSEWPALLFQFDLDVPRVGKDSGCDILGAKSGAFTNQP